MAFEGVEKKMELLLRPKSRSLRDRRASYWRRIVRSTRAEILSSTSNEHCDAYLLSESSLFVFPNRMIMITCGRTRLIDGMERILEDISRDQIESFIYERKNELFPGEQPTTFSSDVERLERLTEGESHVFGNPEHHHLSLFHLTRAFSPDPDDVTTELLMYDLDPRTSALFRPGADSFETLGLMSIFTGFQWDDHIFEPSGYSLNGIKEDRYVTIHITPDVPGSYASLETNCRMDGIAFGETSERLLSILNPARFDLISFQEDPAPLALPETLAILCNTDKRRLSCGYPLHFFHYRAPGR